MKVAVILHKIPVIFVGGLLLGIGINGFLVPHHLLDGGFIGIALIFHYYFQFKVGLWMIILSLPLCLYTWLYERNFFYSSLSGLLISSVIIDSLAPLKNQFHLPILMSALLGGIFIGLGTGLMLRYQTSTGGTDLLAKFISKATSLNIGIVIFIIDGLIITAGFSTLGLRTFLFSCVTILTVGVMSSLIIEPPQLK
jgi:uncharacterized membrane-anchored protein YitT (DUF2179 family)